MYFDCCFGKLGGFQNLEQSLKTTGTRSFRILPMKNATPLLPSPSIDEFQGSERYSEAEWSTKFSAVQLK